MARRIFTLTNVLSVALVAALGLLADALWTALAPPPTVELSERAIPERQARVRRARAMEPGGEREKGMPAPLRIVASTPVEVSNQRPETPSEVGRESGARARPIERNMPAAGVRIRPGDRADRLTIVHLQAEHVAIGAFLLQLARHSTWPDGGPTADESFRIGVLHSEITRQGLVAAVRGQLVGSSPVVVQSETLEEFHQSRIVFVPGFALAPEAAKVLDRWSVLTVTFGGTSAADTWCDVEIGQGADEFVLHVDQRAAERKGIAIDDRLFDTTFVFDRSAERRLPTKAAGGDQPVLPRGPMVTPSGS